MIILGYLYDKIPYRDFLYIIPICLLLLGAIFSCMLHIMYPMFLIEWKEVYKKDIKEITRRKHENLADYRMLIRIWKELS